MLLHLLAQAPALPLDEAGKYVAAAYGVFVTLLVVYVAIIGARIGRVEREVKELADMVESADASHERESAASELVR
jgi:Na+-transporting NADH:ubiquinone oxidoreductase subunit NqrE